MAWPTIGTEETIKGITKEMLQEYFKRHYVPGNMVLAFGGPIVHDQTLKLSQKYFSSLKSEFKPFPKNYFVGSIDEKQNRPGLHFQEDLDSQIELQICFRTCSYNDPDFLVLALISRIFDDGFTSRLQRVRTSNMRRPQPFCGAPSARRPREGCIPPRENSSSCLLLRCRLHIIANVTRGNASKISFILIL